MLRPQRPPVTAFNEITVDAAPAAVWNLLADATSWPRWYAACRWVRETQPGPLPAGATFRWKAHPVAQHSVVSESVPGRAFRFTAAAGLHADHSFTLTETPGGTLVHSEETQHGFLPAVGRPLLDPLPAPDDPAVASGPRRNSLRRPQPPRQPHAGIAGTSPDNSVGPAQTSRVRANRVPPASCTRVAASTSRAATRPGLADRSLWPSSPPAPTRGAQLPERSRAYESRLRHRSNRYESGTSRSR